MSRSLINFTSRDVWGIQLKNTYRTEGTEILESSRVIVWKLIPKQHSSKLLYKVTKFYSFKEFKLVGDLMDFWLVKWGEDWATTFLADSSSSSSIKSTTLYHIYVTLFFYLSLSKPYLKSLREEQNILELLIMIISQLLHFLPSWHWHISWLGF